MITVRWCAGFLFTLALIPAWMGVRDWFLAAFLFVMFVVAFTPWHRLVGRPELPREILRPYVADMPEGHPEEVSRLDQLDGIGGGTH